MTILDYTTYEEVRAVLGVSATELPDLTMAQTQHNLLLTIDLEDVNSGIPDLYTTVSALPEISRSTAQKRFYELTRLFASYTIARNLLTSLPLFSVARLTDGRAEFQRQPDIFADVREGVEAMFNTLRIKLSTIYVVLTPAEALYTSGVFSYATSTGLGTDPVTNA